MRIKKLFHYILAYTDTESIKLTWRWLRVMVNIILCWSAIFHVLSLVKLNMMELHMSVRAVYIHSFLKIVLPVIAMNAVCFRRKSVFILLREKILWNSQVSIFKQMKAPFAIYFNFEYFLVPQNDESNVKAIHEPSGFCILRASQFKQYEKPILVLMSLITSLSIFAMKNGKYLRYWTRIKK